MIRVKRILILSVGLSVILGGGGHVMEAKEQETEKSRLRVSDLSTVRGVVKPVMEVVISSELQAQIKNMPFRDGQRFHKGDLLVDFQCGKYVAELQAAQAEVESRALTVTHHEELGKLNGIAQLEIDVAQSELKKAQATERIAQVTVGRCRITAPFDGRVVKTLVNPYESVNPYDELLSILDDQHFDIELIVPSLDVQWLKAGSPFAFFIDELKTVYKAQVSQVGARIDPVSQTIRVFGTFTEQPPQVLAGMSGSARFTDRKYPEQKTFTPKLKRDVAPLAKK